MTNLLTMTVSKLLENNAIIGLYNEATNTIEVCTTQRSALFLVDSLLQRLKSGTMPNKDAQTGYNNNTLKWVYFEGLTSTNVPRLDYMLLKLRERELGELLAQDGYNVYSGHKLLNLRVEVCKLKVNRYKRFPVQVRVITGRYVVYYVQKHFTSNEEARKFIDNNNIYDIIKATNTIDVPYREFKV